jgi:redox-sensitive bicupin YhaK (pirin superfamily)
MITIRKSSERGGADHGWLRSAHSFSFSEYFDPAHMRFRVLRVINEDWIQPSKGFGTHAHQNMEIITFVISGVLTHKDSLGNIGTIAPGEIQRMTAGSGIEHSEFNASSKEVCQLLQIWILPSSKDLAPSWQQVSWKSRPEEPPGLRLLVSPDGRNETAMIHQDTSIWHGSISDEKIIALDVKSDRGGWMQVIRGQALINDQSIEAGDGVAVDGLETMIVKAFGSLEFLWFDLA